MSHHTHAPCNGCMEELDQLSAERTARPLPAPPIAARRDAGEALWVELQDAAFGYADVHWKVQRDAPTVLEAWRALLAQPSG